MALVLGAVLFVVLPLAVLILVVTEVTRRKQRAEFEAFAAVWEKELQARTARAAARLRAAPEPTYADFLLANWRAALEAERAEPQAARLKRALPQVDQAGREEN